MKRLCFRIRCIRRAFARIHLVDKCLIVFMAVLLMQSAFNLLCDRGPEDTNNIDVIIRTSTAAIFGYFISANFIRRSSPEKPNDPPQPPSLPPAQNSGSIQNRIGFSAEEPSGEQPDLGHTQGSGDQENPESTSATHMQIIAAASIGLFCLLVLIILRNFSGLGNEATATPSSSATVAQFRDFVSGCVGFLIGCPTQKPRD